MLAAISIGSVYVPVTDIVSILSVKILHLPAEQIDPMYTSIVWSIRVPRVLLAGLVGASLAIAGAAFQRLLRNL